MEDWLAIAADVAASSSAASLPAVLVTVAIVEGSVPREPGAKMLVDAVRQWGTVGGGHLELRGAETARAMLVSGEQRRLERFPLGPGLGQCCGGVVHLAFELVDQAHLAALAARRHQDSWRLVLLDAPLALVTEPLPAPLPEPALNAALNASSSATPDLALLDADGHTIHGSAPAIPAFDRAQGTHVLRDEQGRRWLADLVAAPRAHLMLFGAGHVGAAIVRALADLPCRVTWVDERDDLFPAELPHNVAVEATDTPEALAQHAPAGTSFLVMTHSHALDQRLAETILKRSNPGHDWFGLIGSSTKRTQFERRLLERGVDRARLDAMVCPIGIPGIEGKLPAVIAVAVAAQLLMVWEDSQES
jgi:xanthine dehydrogenase accessory factor